MLVVLQVAVALVLLIACTNLANLLLARTAGRRPELALRAALGARRRDLLRQLLVETGTLALLGGALGLLVALAGIRGLLALGPRRRARPRSGWTSRSSSSPSGLSIAAGLGARPRARAAGQRLGPGRQPARHGPRRRRRDDGGRAPAAILVAAEVGLSLVLLVGAGLLLRTLHRSQATNPGFRPDHLLTVQLLAAEEPLRNARRRSRASPTRSTARLAELPGVSDVTRGLDQPAHAVARQHRVHHRGTRRHRPREGALGQLPRDRARATSARSASRCWPGRDVEAHDFAGSTPVALISQTLARRHFPDRSPLGERLEIDDAALARGRDRGRRRRRQAHRPGRRADGRRATSRTRRPRPTSRSGWPTSSASPCARAARRIC